MKNTIRVIIALIALFAISSSAKTQSESADLQSQVVQAERAFARTMADRDHKAFKSFLSEEAVFLSGKTVTRGRQAVAAQWMTYFTESTPPFSWEPETIEVLDSENLAMSTGPVMDIEGQRISTYTSIWRQEEPGIWRIIFDKGDKYCK